MIDFICIDTGRVPELTLYKKYKAVLFVDTTQVINDNNRVVTYKRERFITLEDWREKQLKNVGI
jgi:hypothetical protein